MRLLVLGGTRFVGRAVVAARTRTSRGCPGGWTASPAADASSPPAGPSAAWVDEADLAAAGVQPWTQLPCWVPETGADAGVFAGDSSRALAAGLDCRPVEQTVADTWAWVQEAGVPKGRPGSQPGLPVELERALLQ